MTEDSFTAVRVVFHPPDQDHSSSRASTHERTLERVPHAVARQMMNDFRAYEARPSAEERYEMYAYSHQNGTDEQVLVPIDFGEVLALTAMSDEATA